MERVPSAPRSQCRVVDDPWKRSRQFFPHPHTLTPRAFPFSPLLLVSTAVCRHLRLPFCVSAPCAQLTPHSGLPDRTHMEQHCREAPFLDSYQNGHIPVTHPSALGCPRCPTPAGRLFLLWHRLLAPPHPSAVEQKRRSAQRCDLFPISTTLSHIKFSSYCTNHLTDSSLTSAWYHFNACMHAKDKHSPCENVREEAAGPREEACANSAAQAVGTTLVVLWGGVGGQRSWTCLSRPSSDVTALCKHWGKGREIPRRKKSSLSKNTILAQEQMSIKWSEISLGWKLRAGF